MAYLHYNQLVESVADARFAVSRADQLAEYICAYLQSRPGAVRCGGGGGGGGVLGKNRGVREPKGVNHRHHAAFSLRDVAQLDAPLAAQIRRLAERYGLDADQ